MMSGAQIAAMSRQAAQRSAREKRIPLFVEAEDLVNDDVLSRHLRRIPFLGDRKPNGFRVAGDLSKILGSRHALYGDGERWPENSLIEVDSSGFGSPGEPALTHGEFLAAVRKLGPGYGYGIMEVGQFQVVLSVFKAQLVERR